MGLAVGRRAASRSGSATRSAPRASAGKTSWSGPSNGKFQSCWSCRPRSSTIATPLRGLRARNRGAGTPGCVTSSEISLEQRPRAPCRPRARRTRSRRRWSSCAGPLRGRRRPPRTAPARGTAAGRYGARPTTCTASPGRSPRPTRRRGSSTAGRTAGGRSGTRRTSLQCLMTSVPPVAASQKGWVSWSGVGRSKRSAARQAWPAGGSASRERGDRDAAAPSPRRPGSRPRSRARPGARRPPRTSSATVTVVVSVSPGHVCFVNRTL